MDCKSPNEQAAHELAMITLAISVFNNPDIKGETDAVVISAYVAKEYKNSFGDLYYSILNSLNGR